MSPATIDLRTPLWLPYYINYKHTIDTKLKMIIK